MLKGKRAEIDRSKSPRIWNICNFSNQHQRFQNNCQYVNLAVYEHKKPVPVAVKSRSRVVKAEIESVMSFLDASMISLVSLV